MVAILIPVIADLAHEGNTAPSKLLMPLSFASMLGGTLTLIGTSTNSLASDIAAQSIGANAFAFVLAVTFAASTAFVTPVGYQTNLFVYGRGGYTLPDFIRVGAPLQFLRSIVTVRGVAFFWGVRV